VKSNLDADVIVIGGGLAGLCASLEAAKAGAEVLLLEKQASLGGSTKLSGGSVAFAGTEEQKRQGVEDSSELLARDMLEVGEYANDADLVQVYADNQLDAYRWLVSRGVTFGPIQAASGQSVPRQHPLNPAELIETLLAEATGVKNIRIITGAAAIRLDTDLETGRVTGVLVKDGKDLRRAAAVRSIILTAGGFSRNKDMIERFTPKQAPAKRVGGPGNVGDGILMAARVGAALRDMEFVKGTFGNHPDAGAEQHTATLAIYKGAIAVNRLGRRFANESISYKLLGDACLDQPGYIGYQIFDAGVMAKAVPQVKIFDFETRLTQGLLLTAPNLAELAKKVNIPADELEQTVARYNRSVAAGKDEEFGRTGLVQGYGALAPIETPPFYAYPSTSAVIATYCGATVDTEMRVIDVMGQPIPGLYAAGEMTGGFHGKAFMTGTSLGKCVICGRLAGRNAAKQ